MEKVSLLLIFLSLTSSFSQACSDKQPSDIHQWCSTTPHPEACKHFMGRFAPSHQADFRKLAVEVAMEQAIRARVHANELGPRYPSRRSKIAWVDCTKLFADAVLQLNRTLEGLQATKRSSGCSDFDAQTWLSTALTNLETCRLGSAELNVSRFLSPIVPKNVTELISNTLAINGALLDHDNQEEVEEGFPVWVSESERKLLQGRLLVSQVNYVVAKDGSGRFKSIQKAINYAVSRRRGSRRILIYVKRGVYRENVDISSYMSNIMLIGDGLKRTIITGSRSMAGGFTTYSSATFGVEGPGFIARGITFRNTAGPQNGQAVALRSASDLSVFYACAIEGYQDTLFVLAQRQFFKSCYIYGTIDFIFGNAAVVLQSCLIYVRKPLHGQASVITAQGRADPFQNTGISIHLPGYLDGLVHPEGWLAWRGSRFAQDTLYYGEYRNFGPGSSTRRRVRWPGYHVIKRRRVALRFTVTNLIAGEAWLLATGVPFIADL
ncbi:Pectinesterase [Bertholletia excelsa]